MNKAIERAAKIVGNKNKLAKAVGVSNTAVNKWVKGGGINLKSAMKIEEITEGKVTTKQILDGIPN